MTSYYKITLKKKNKKGTRSCER